MRALSIKQPWAWCIVTGRKPVENRSWPTRYRGRFLVHAGKSFDVDGYNWLLQEGLIPDDMTPADFPRGGIVGAAVITDCVDQMDTPWFFGPYGFTLEHGEEFPLLLPMRGQLGFFDPRLTAADFLSMVKRAETLGQIVAVVNCLDFCWRENGMPVQPNDWLTLERTARESKRRIEGAQRVEEVANG